MTVADAQPVETDWTTCSTAGCTGAAIGQAGGCLAHLDEQELAGWLRRIGRGRPLDARGVTFDDALLQRVLAAAPVDAVGRRVLNRPRFDSATFEGGANLESLAFEREVSFDRAAFHGDVSFQESVFDGHARFGRATFDGDARFGAARFTHQAWFAASTFTGEVSFDRVAFEGPSWFSNATFRTDVGFTDATFGNDTFFDRTEFQCHSFFPRATFDAGASFGDATFAHQARFDGAAFKGAGGAPQAAARQAQWSRESLAGWSRRAAAALIDVATFLAFPAGAFLVAVLLARLQYYGLLPWLLAAGVVAASVVVGRDLVEQGHTGQTRGKALMGVCLVRERDGLPVGVRTSFARTALHVLDAVPLLVGLLWPLWDTKRQTFADKLLSTVVVERQGWERAGSSDGPVAEGPVGGFG